MRRYLLSVLLVLSICLIFLLHTISAQPSNGECSAPASNPASVHRAEISIDAVTVLLPVHVHSGETIYHVKYPIQARGACFSWRTDKPHLIRLEPIAETRCSETVSVKNAQTGQFETVTKEGYTGIYVSAVTHVPNASDKPVGYPFTSNRHFQRRLSAWISAHDITRETERFEQCEIFIDQIARLEILTSTRRINVGDIEALDLAAYDSMDNVFSSLDGLPFRWDNSAPANLKQLSLFESGLEVEEELKRLERTGVATRIMPVKGSLPGKVNMTATLVDDTHHISTTVPFLVIEPLYLEPNQRRLAPGSELQMKLKTRFSEDKIKHTSNVIHETEAGEEEEGAAGSTSPPGGMSVPASASAAADTQIIQRREITMPSSQYKWSSLDKGIVAINEHSGMLVARSPGHTNVVVKDVNAPAHYKEAEITVVEPVKILLDLRPYNPNSNMNNALALRNWKKPRVSCAATGIAATGGDSTTPSWFIQEGALYELFISLKDSSDKFISITPNVVFELTVKGKSISRSNQAQRVHIASDASGKATSSLIVSLSSAIPLVASALGSSTITVSLTSIKSVENNMEHTLKPGPLKSTATIHVTPSVSLLGSSPWKLPLVTPSTPKYQLRAEGGSGKYTWESTNAQALRVEQSGIDAGLSNATASAFVVPLQAGLIPVKVTDSCNPENSFLLDVNVSPPRSLDFIKLKNSRYESSIVASDNEHHTIDVYVRVRGSTETGHQSFHDCSKLFLLASFQSGNKGFQSFQPPTAGTGSTKSTPANVFQCLTECPVEAGSNCFHLQLRSTQVEMSALSLNLIDSNSAQGIPLHGVSGISQHFSAFSPLYYQYAPLLLGVGEGVMVQMQGGPLAWPQRGLFNGIQPTTVTHATYSHLTEVLFSQTYFSATSDAGISNGGLFDRSELEAASFLKSDISSKEILQIQQVPGSAADRFFVSCNKASEDAIALHIVSSNSRDLGNQGINPLPNPLAAHRSIRVQCYPRLKLASEPSRLAIGESKTVSIEPHPLSKFVRYALREGDNGEVFTVDAVSGVVKGIRLGQRLVVASVDRSALLKSLGFPDTTLQPYYGPGDALSDSKRLSVEFDNFRLRFASPYYAPNILLKSHTSIADVIGENNESLLDPSYDKVQCLWRIDSSIGGIGITPALSSNHASHISSWNTYHAPVPAGDHSFDSLVHSQVYGCSIRVIGLKIGTFTLSVAINVTLPHQSSRSSYFEHSIDITVVEPLRLYSNEQLLLAPGSTSQILTNIQNTHLAYMNASLRYTVSLYESTTNKNGAYISVDERGLITVRQRMEGDDHRDIADAVILIQSSHALLANSTASSGDAAESQPVVQSLVVLVSMRPIAQLFVASSDLPSSLLCPSRSYNFTLGVASSIGKRFHVFPADEDLPNVVSNLHDSSVTPISVDILPAVLPSSNVEHALRAYTLLIGEADASHNVVLQHRLIQFDIESQPNVTPLTLPVYIAPSGARCVEPNAILLKLKVSYTRKVWDDQYKINSVRRDEFVARFVSEIGDALHFTRETAAARIKIFNIDISSNVVELLLLPLSFAGSYHRDQWFYHYFTVAPSNQLDSPTGSPHALIANEEAWTQTPLSLAQALQKQVLDRSRSALVWSGELTSAIDAAAPFTRNEISPLEAQHMVRERSESSSPLSTPASTSSTSGASDNTASSSSDSVWADERSVATLERVLGDGGADMHHDSGINAAEAMSSAAASAAVTHDGSSSASSSSSSSLSLSGAVEQFEKERKRTMEDFRELLKSYQAEQVRINTPLEFQQAQLQQQYYKHASGTGLLAPPDSLLALIISLLLNPIVLAVIFAVLGVLYFIWETGFKPSEQEKLLRENLPAAVQADILARARFTSWLWRGILNVFCCRRSPSARARGAVGVAGAAGGMGGGGGSGVAALSGNVVQQRGGVALGGGGGFVGPNQYQQQRELHQQPAAIRLNLTPRSAGVADIYRQY